MSQKICKGMVHRYEKDTWNREDTQKDNWYSKFQDRDKQSGIKAILRVVPLGRNSEQKSGLN